MSEQLTEEKQPKMDWEQVALNGGPPCFALLSDEDGWYCGRAERWDGHDGEHNYVSLEQLLASQRKRFDLWFGAGSCSVCGGAPLASGRPCVCGGKGTMQAEFEGLRLACFEQEKELIVQDAKLDAMRAEVEKLREGIRDCGGTCVNHSY